MQYAKAVCNEEISKLVKVNQQKLTTGNIINVKKI
jgi:hypothetical protein